jgi:hypothetical protein
MKSEFELEKDEAYAIDFLIFFYSYISIGVLFFICFHFHVSYPNRSSGSSTESQEEGEKEVSVRRYSLTKSIKSLGRNDFSMCQFHSLGPRKEITRSEPNSRIKSDASGEGMRNTINLSFWDSLLESDSSSVRKSLSFSGLFGFGKSEVRIRLEI